METPTGILLSPYEDKRCEIFGGTNPIVLTGTYLGATVRVYKDRMVDATDGPGFSLSPGFSTVVDCLSWIDDMAKEYPS